MSKLNISGIKGYEARALVNTMLTAPKSKSNDLYCAVNNLKAKGYEIYDVRIKPYPLNYDLMMAVIRYYEK